MRGSEPLTEFEKPRGVSGVEVRDGFAQAIVEDLAEPIGPARTAVLKAVATAGVSIDFLKMSPSGMSFLVPAEKAAGADGALKGLGCRYELKSPRSIVMVHAVNMRDEEGLIARIVSTAIGSGLALEHLGDMHDRMLIVLESADARRLAEMVETDLKGVAG